MSTTVSATTPLLQDTRAAMDRVGRAHYEWRGSIIGDEIGDEVSGARATLAAVDNLLMQADALRAALVAFIEERTT